MNYSLLRYPGGKTRAVDILSKYVPESTKEVVSPFFGGGSFEISLIKKGINVHAYDNFNPLVCFWYSVMNERERLIDIIKGYYPISKDNFYRLQDSIDEIKDPAYLGAIYFVLNRASFSGTGLSGGMSPNHPRFNTSSIKRIESFEESFKIEKMSFEQSLKRHDCFVFADPPYLVNPVLYGKKGDLHKGFDHLRLSNILKDKGNFLLTYNNCEEIKDLYSGCNFYYPDWKYGMSKDKNSKEIIITK